MPSSASWPARRSPSASCTCAWTGWARASARLLALAKQESEGHLWPYTFARNARARSFYAGRGFLATAHGFEPEWQLQDLRYEWRRTPAAGLRLAVAQIPMYWELRDNLAAMRRAMHVARDHGAALCAFAELAVTGFHRRIAEGALPERVGPAVAELQALAARLGMAAAFGVPTFGKNGNEVDGAGAGAGADAEGGRFNSHVFVDAQGRLVGCVAKNGLTAPEATFFDAGRERPVFPVCDLVGTAVICREIEDFEVVTRQLAGTGVQLILWPGQMRPDPAKPVADPPGHVRDAQAMARATNAFIVQTNWPNALNRPEESQNTGHSACISPEGRLLFRLPRQGLGVGVFDLGDETVTWLPVDA